MQMDERRVSRLFETAASTGIEVYKSILTWQDLASALASALWSPSQVCDRSFSYLCDDESSFIIEKNKEYQSLMKNLDLSWPGRELADLGTSALLASAVQLSCLASC